MSSQVAPVLVRSLDGNIRLWNPSAEHVYGWEREQAVGKSSHLLFQTEFPYSLDEINRQLLSKGFWEGELIHTRKSGQKVRVHSRWELSRDLRGDSVTVFEINRAIEELPGRVIPFPVEQVRDGSRSFERIPDQPTGMWAALGRNYPWWLIPLVMIAVGILVMLCILPSETFVRVEADLHGN